MASEIVLFITLFGSPLLMVYFYLRYKTKKLEVLRELAHTDKPLSPELINLLHNSSEKTPMGDLRLAVIYSAVGISTMIILGFETFNNPAKLMLLGLLPLSIGLGYFVIMAANLRGKA